MSRKGVRKLGPVEEGVAHSREFSVAESLLSSLKTQAPSVSTAARSDAPGAPPHALGGAVALGAVGDGLLPPCPSADAVERLLSADEVDDLAVFPVVPGAHFDRRTQRLVMPPPAVGLGVVVDSRKSVAEVVDAARQAEEDRMTALERKGLVTSRVISRLKQRRALAEEDGL